MRGLVTFDAAGTLVDHRWDPGGLSCAAAAELGMSLNVAEGRRFYEEVEQKHRAEVHELERMGDRAAVRALWQRQMADWLLLMGEDPASAKETLDVFLRMALSPYSRVWALYDDVLPALDRLSNDGYSIGVVSNWDHTLHEVLSFLGIYDRFDFIIASLELGYEKPDRRIFAEALRLGNSLPGCTAHVGDSFEADYEGARLAGVQPLLIDRASEPDLLAGRLSSLEQIPEAISW